jgi:hypothetical protein
LGRFRLFWAVRLIGSSRFNFIPFGSHGRFDSGAFDWRRSIWGGSIRGGSIRGGSIRGGSIGASRLGGSIGSDYFGPVDWRRTVGAVGLVPVDSAVGLG